LQDQIIIGIGNGTHCAAERPFIGFSVGPGKRALKIAFAFLEGNRVLEF